MILDSVQVRKFKSILDSGAVAIDPDVTCLVGKNESGKTAFLEAAFRVNPISSGSGRSRFDELHDYNRRLRMRERQEIPNTRAVTASFELEDEDVEAVELALGEGVVESKEAVVSKTYDNDREWTLDLDEPTAARHLLRQRGLDESEANGCGSVDELEEKLRAKESQPEAVETLLEHLESFDLYAEARQVLKDRLPKVLYFDQYSTLPGRLSIKSLQETPEADLTKSERTALSFLRLAGVETEEFTEQNYEARRAALEAAALQITDEVFEYWSQNKNLRVVLDIDFVEEESEDSTARNPQTEQVPYLEVRIRNDRSGVSLNFSERSSGFVWFFSFLAFFSEYRGSEDDIVLLLDEPGLNLHAAAQRDLMRFIDERLAPGHQVVYTTHSPFMIDASKLERARTVEVHEKDGTKVNEDIFAASRDTIFPLQGALGYDLSQTLFVSPNNLVVEGPSDIVYLQVLGEHLESEGRVGLDPRWSLVPAGGADKIPTFIALLGSQLNISVILDAAAGGNQKIDAMVNRGLLEPEKLIPLSEVVKGSEADIEDLFTPSFYLTLFSRSGGDDFNVGDLQEHSRIVRRIERTLGNRFNHYKPAAHFLRNQDQLLPKLSDSTLDRFEALFEKVNANLIR